MPVHGLFWLHIDSFFDNLGVTMKGAIKMLNWVMELSSNVDMSQNHSHQLWYVHAKNFQVWSPSIFDH